MKTQNMEVSVDSELAVFEVERIIKFTRPDIFSNRYGNFDNKSYKTLQDEVLVIIKALDEKNLMPKYTVIDVAEYAKKTNNLFAKVIVEIDYHNEITGIHNADKIKTIKDIVGYNGIAYNNCKDKINEIYREKFVRTKSISEIESIMAKCPTQCTAYDFGTTMLIPYYKTKVDKLSSRAQITDFLNYIKHDCGIYLNSSKSGEAFLQYCDKRTYQLDIEQSETKEQVFQIRNTIFNLYKDLVAICDEKLISLTKVDDTNYLSNDKIMETYKYLTQSFQRRNLLSKYLSEARTKNDTNFYWFIYQELLTDFPECDNEIAMAKHKLVQAFHARTSEGSSFKVVYNIFYKPDEQKIDRVSQNLIKDGAVLATIVDRVSKATILDLEKSIVPFCYSRNYEIYQAFIKKYFTLEPNIIDMLCFEEKMFSIRSFLNDFNELMEMFYGYVNSIVLQSVRNNKIDISEIEGYFAITNNPRCCEAKKVLIQELAEMR